MNIVYPPAVTTKLQAIADAQKITIGQATQLVEDDIAVTGHSLSDVLAYFLQNPADIANRIVNRLLDASSGTKATAATPLAATSGTLVASTTSKKKILILAGVLVLVVALGLVVWKKYKK